MPATETISIAAAETLATDALAANEVSKTNAASVARALVAAEAEGQVGHGLSRLGDYVAQARSGKVDGHAVPQVEAIAPGSARIDAGNGFAYPALDRAVTWGIDAAEAQGSASMAVTRSHHCGALSVQVDRIAAAGLIGLMFANAPAAMAPSGANVPVFGTNPIAFAAPRRNRPPLVIDLSLSVVARGKVMNAMKTRQPIPRNWALDGDGRPTTDPEAALAGTMLPIGGAKGTALALMVEILSATFTAANASTDVSSFFTADGPPSGSGQTLIALKPHDGTAFTDRIEALLGLIAGLEGARLPGDRRAAAVTRARAGGLTVPSVYLDGARALATGTGPE